MSQQDVEIVKQMTTAFDRGDYETAAALIDDEVEWHVGRILGPEMGVKPVYRGIMGVFDFFREWSSSWDEVKFHYDEYIDAGDYVLAQLRQTTRGRASGIELSLGYVIRYDVRGGKVARLEFFRTKEDALGEAASADQD